MPDAMALCEEIADMVPSAPVRPSEFLPELGASLIAVATPFPVFKGLPAERLAALLEEAQYEAYPKGAELFQQDEPSHAFFLLLRGHLRVTRLTPDGQQVVVRFISTGEFFGLSAPLGRTSYPATATAVVDSIALSWPSTLWPRLQETHPVLVGNLLHAMGSRLNDAHTRLVELSTEQVEQRIAHALLRLASQSGRKVEAGIRIDFPISREDVAEMTGATLFTVSRILHAWDEKGLVEGGRQKITLRDPHRIFEIAEGRRS